MADGKKIYWMIKKDLLSLKRHPQRLVSIIAFPVIMILLFGYGMGGELTDLPVVVVSQSNGTLTDITLETIKSTDTFHVTEVTDDIDDAKAQVDNGNVKAAIILPTDYDSNASSKSATLYVDSSEQMASNTLIPATQGIFSKLSAISSSAMGVSPSSNATGNTSAMSGETAINLENATITPTVQNTIDDFADSVSLHINQVYGNIKYIDYLVPAILGMTVMMSCTMGMGSSVAGERETGELSRLFMTPTSVSTVIGGKIISKLVIEVGRALILLFMAIVLFQVAVRGGILETFIVLLIGALCFVGFGVMMSARAATQEDYTQMVMPFSMPMMFVSGVFYPIETMPWIFQKIAYIFPLTYLNDAMRGIMIKGQSLGDVWVDIVILLLFTLLFFVLGVKRFNRDV